MPELELSRSSPHIHKNEDPGCTDLTHMFSFVPPVHMLVGSGENCKEYYIPKTLLMRHEGFFKDIFTHPFREASENAIELPDDAPKVFDFFVNWMVQDIVHRDKPMFSPDGFAPHKCTPERDLQYYQRRWECMEAVELKSITVDMDMKSGQYKEYETYELIDPRIAQIRTYNSTMHHLNFFVQSYIFADRYRCMPFLHHVLRILYVGFPRWELNKSKILTLDMIQTVYDNTARKEDELRRLLIKALCYGPVETVVQDGRFLEICRVGSEMMEDLIAEIQRMGREAEEKAAADKIGRG